LSVIIVTTNKKQVIKSNEDDYKINTVNFEKYFNGLDGCAVFYSVKDNVYDVYNYDMIDVREIPCSTFKIVSALAGLKYGVIENKDTVLKWDGTEQMIKSWEKDLSLDEAFKLSANWYFEIIDNEVGVENMKKIVNDIGYGNEDMTGKMPLGEANLKISPMEQLDFIMKLFNNELPFEEKHINTVKEIMLLNSQNGKLYGKTGTSGTMFLENGNQTAWFIGKYETENNQYYFALRIYGDKNNENIRGPVAQEITEKICKELYYLK